MIYVVGFIGLIGGFAIGQMILYFLLRHVPKEDLLNDASIKWTYGTLNWIIAVATCYIMISMYRYHFQ